MTARSVLITGGNRGIGLATAQRLATAGHRVAITHRGSGGPEGFLSVKCDVTDSDAVEACFSEVEVAHGPVEVLVSNAGVAEDALLLRMDEAGFQRILDTNLTGAFRVAKRASRSMLRGRWGRLLFVSSVVGLSGSAGQASYAASKAGLVGFARSLARELGPRGITSNVVAPGFVATDMTAGLRPERTAEIIRGTPLGRMASPAEIASVIAFLAGDEASYVTGAVVPVDGGLGMGH